MKRHNDVAIDVAKIGFQGVLSPNDNTLYKILAKLDANVGYSIEDFIDVSTGVPDAGKPIVLNSEGLVDQSMINVSSFYYVGPFTPTSTDGVTIPTGVTVEIQTGSSVSCFSLKLENNATITVNGNIEIIN